MSFRLPQIVNGYMGLHVVDVELYTSTIHPDDTCVPAFLHYIFTSSWELFILMFSYNVTLLPSILFGTLHLAYSKYSDVESMNALHCFYYTTISRLCTRHALSLRNDWLTVGYDSAVRVNSSGCSYVVVLCIRGLYTAT